MNKAKSFNLKTFLTIVVSFITVVCLMLTVACSKSGDSSGSASNADSSSSSSSSSSSARTDAQAITNGDFEYSHDGTTEPTSFPVSSSIGWTRSNDSIVTTAPSSTKSSGIIRTTVSDEYDYNAFAENSDFPYEEVDGTKVYYNPSNPVALGYISEDELYEYDEDNANGDKLLTKGDYVLMIRNKTTNEAGTAQKFTSTKTVTVSSYGKISVWVLTYDLKSAMEGVDYGAYVSLTNTIGSTKSPFVVKNINTDGKWQKIEIYLKASDLGSSTFKVVLGLGFGSKEIQTEFVEGFAFFDNVRYEEVSAADYAAATANKTVNLFKSVAEKIETYEYDADSEDFEVKKLFAAEEIDAADMKVSYKTLTPAGKDVDEDGNDDYKVYTVAYSHAYPVNGINASIDTENSKINTEKFINNSSEDYAMNAVYGIKAFNAIENEKLADVVNPIAADANTLYVINNNGASTTVALSSDDFVVYDGTSLYITFLMKVSTGENQSGVTITVKDLGTAKGEKKELESIDVVSSVNTNDVEDDDLNDWVRVNLFVNNFNDDKFERYFSVEITFGTTAVAVQKQSLLTEGYALFTGFESAYLDKDGYDATSRSGDYDMSAALGADIINPEADDTKNDTYSLKYAASGEASIRDSVVGSILNFTGTVGNGLFVGGNDETYGNENVIAGIINTKYVNNYATLADVKTQLEGLTPDEDNEYVQPMIIYNKVAASYGYVSTENTFSAGNSTLVSVKLQVFGEAKAYIYLTSSDPLDSFKVLTVEGKKVNRDGKKPVYTDEYDVNEQLYFVIDANDCDGDFVTVNFFVTAGETDRGYRVEIFNGARKPAGTEYTAEELSQGLVVIDSVTYNYSSNKDTFLAELYEKFALTDSDVVNKDYAGIVRTVTYTDSDGFNNVKYTNDPAPVTVYSYIDKAHTLFASYENIDVQTELDETTAIVDDETEETEETDEDYENNHSMALQITSVILSSVLVLVLLVLVFRALFKKMKKQGASNENYYSRNSRERAQDFINANKSKREAAAKAKAGETVTEKKENEDEVQEEEQEEKVSDYDYDNPENNV